MQNVPLPRPNWVPRGIQTGSSWGVQMTLPHSASPLTDAWLSITVPKGTARTEVGRADTTGRATVGVAVLTNGGRTVAFVIPAAQTLGMPPTLHAQIDVWVDPTAGAPYALFRDVPVSIFSHLTGQIGGGSQGGQGGTVDDYPGTTVYPSLTLFPGPGV